MVPIFKDLWKKYLDESICGKFIYINVAVYLLVAVAGVFATLFTFNMQLGEFLQWFELPSSLQQILYQPWSIITYMFMHKGLMHILWNMLALYAFGRIFLQFYSSRHFVGVYLLGGVTGGLFFLLSYNLLPYFDGVVGHSYLVGASASVLAVVMASAIRSPHYRVNLFLFGSVRLMTIAIVTVIISFLLITSDNAGGNIAHLGGAFAGWVFAYMLNKGRDIVKPINYAIDAMVNFFTKGVSCKRKPKFKYVKTGKRSADYNYNARKKEQEDEMNRILDKVKKSGYSSLSDEEKRRLFDVSK